jgi:serine/threonine protein kinase
MSSEPQYSMAEQPHPPQSALSPRSQSVASRDNADSVASSQQTRFSFYNAEDFKVVGSSAKDADTQPQQRFNFYNVAAAEDLTTLTHKVVQTVEALAGNNNSEPSHADDGTGKSLDSAEILKSLQEHEQQRSEILAGPKAKTAAPPATNNISSIDVNSCQQQNNVSFNGGYSSGENSNPYEDAIKEALQLLRKHRSAPRISGPLSVERNIVTTGPSEDLERLRSNDLDEHQQQLQQEFQDLMIRTRSPPGAPRTAPNSSAAVAGNWDDTTMPTPLSDAGGGGGGLGEAYQAEIEARRKQRQERMARYASRLAELKQEDDDGGPPAVDTARSLDSSVDYGKVVANGIARGSAHQQHPWNYHRDHHHHPNNTAMFRNNDWEEDDVDPIVAARSTEQLSFTPTNVIAPASSNADSMSTLSNTNKQQEDEVQRSVERVLLAILERANSRGRTPASLESSGIYPPSSTTTDNNVRPQHHLSPAPAISQDEEKKSNSDDRELENAIASTFYPQQDDALLQAMSDLLGQPRSVSTAAAAATDDEDDPSTSLATQEEPTALLASTQTSHNSSSNGDHVFPSVIVADDSVVPDHYSNDPDTVVVALPHQAEIPDSSNASAPSELDRMVERVFRQGDVDIAGAESSKDYTSCSSQRDPIDQVTSSQNIDTSASMEVDSSSNDRDDVDGRNRSSDHSSDGLSSDETVEETLDEALGTDNDEESASFDDDDSSGDEYDSDEVDARYKGSLGPRSNRVGGTTGIVLEDDSSSSSSSSTSSEDNEAPRTNGQSVTSHSLLESLSAAVSLVTGITPIDDKQLSPQLARKDKYALDHPTSDDDSDVDSEANELMRSLCAHLLPVGVDQSSRLLDKVPDWDESNPDEAGYRIVRLNGLQLRRVHKEYDRMVDSLKQKSQRSPAGEMDESAFERDLRAAEDLLDQEEKLLNKAEKVLADHTSTPPQASPNNGKPIEPCDTVECDSLADTRLDEPEGLAGFSGVKPTGKGEMGELEYFSLPVIFKSHVTGFEPTKDLMLEPGNVVAGQYLVEGVLGSAAFSTAYKCTDLNSEEDSSGCQDLVCLKVIKNTKDFFDQSLDEIKILELLRQTGKCNENFIVEMKTFFYHREHLIIVTELLRQNLFEFGKFILDSGEEPYFTITRLSYITWQCLIALNFVHDLGLVHSDVKPENILLASYSRAQAKLIDFGSSCYLTDRQSSYIQSRSYRAPEVVLGLPYDGRIDIWSLGCVVAEMFTGEVTFQNDSIVSMLSRIEAICGPFPRHMIAQGRQSSRFFTKCGLLFEKVTRDNAVNNESYSGESSNEEGEKLKAAHIDIFQPKRTTLAARLGLPPDLIEKFDSGKPLGRDDKQKALFVDLVRKLLTIDPESRPTAAEALEHPAMLYAATLTEAEIKYPSS